MQISNRASTHVQGAFLDILPHILPYTVPTYSSPKEIAAPSLSQAPLNVSHVCKAWRNIALASSSLWSAIQLDVDNFLSNAKTTRLAERRLAWLHICVARSGQSTLDLYVCAQMPPGVYISYFGLETTHRITAATRNLLELRSRWMTVIMDVHVAIL